MIYELNHVGLFVRDLDASLAFYVGLLGGRVADRAIIPATATDCVYVQVGTGLVELLRSPAPPPDLRFGLNHTGFMSDDLDGDYQRLAAAGCPFDVPPRAAGTGRGRVAFLSDPHGARTELLQRREEFRGPAVPGAPVARLDHVGVYASDLAAAAFYGGQLALPQLRSSPAACVGSPFSSRYTGRLALSAEAIKGSSCCCRRLGGSNVRLACSARDGTVPPEALPGMRAQGPRTDILRCVRVPAHRADPRQDVSQPVSGPRDQRGSHDGGPRLSRAYRQLPGGQGDVAPE